MYFKFLKPFLFFSTGALMAFTSCSDDKDTNDEALDASTILDVSLSDEAFNKLAQEVKSDPSVIEYTILDPGNPDSIKTNSLKDNRDRVHPYAIRPRLHAISGRYFSSSNNNQRYSYNSLYDHAIIDVDLNKGAGGDYVYLYTGWLTEEDDNKGYAITSLVSSPDKNYIKRNCSGYVNLGYSTEWLDCNHNTKKGGPIYLGYRLKKDYGGSPIRGIMVVAYDHKHDDNVGGYDREVNVGDLNAGCGSKSKYIYIFTKK